MSEPADVVVRLRRTIPAPPPRVYRAWLDPVLLGRWFAPAIYVVRHAEVDERVGGHVRVWQEDHDGNDVGGAQGDILELVPHERIVLRWHFLDPDRVAHAALESRLTITFTPGPDNTTHLHLTHERLDGLRAHRPDVADNIADGWDSALDVLTTTIRTAEQ